MRVLSTGVAAHAGNDPERGKSAIWSLSRFVDGAHALTDLTRGTSVNVGTIAGGTSKNTVAESARAEVDLRFQKEEDGQALWAALEVLGQERALPGTRIELTRTAWRPPMVRTEASAALARAYGACQEASGLGAGEAPLSGGGSDACTTSGMGIPSIDGLGPRGAGFHTTEERVELGLLVPKAAALARFLGQLAG